MNDIDRDIDEMQWKIEGKTPCCGGEYTTKWRTVPRELSVLVRCCSECQGSLGEVVGSYIGSS